MMKYTTLLMSIGFLNRLQNVSSFAFYITPPPKQQQRNVFARVARSLSMTANDADNDSSSSLYEPYFQMQQIPTATTGAKLDRIVQCADNGIGMCNVEEMMEMMEELERLNLECHGAMSRECSLDAVAARNVLKVALAANVAAVDDPECTLSHLYDADGSHHDPYSDMNDMHDECLNSKMTMHPIPTATAGITSVQQKLDHIVECAENGQCNIQEMTNMIEELERLNMDCDNIHGSSRECLLDAVEARNILKVALASRVAHMEEQPILNKKQQRR